MSSAQEVKESPQVTDSDLMIMAISRMQRAAEKMQKLEYDDVLDDHMRRAGEMLEWVVYNMQLRKEAPGV